VTNDNVRIAMASAVGALLGGVAGYLFLTERGRETRLQIAPAMEELKQELASFGRSLEGASGIAREGWKLLQELAAEDAGVGPGRSVTH
jgi:hypothetical protein